MDTQNMQQIVDQWVKKPGHNVTYFPPFEMIAQLTEETGEVAREISHLHGHKKKKEGEKTDGLETELGDLLFALCCIANVHNINLSSAFEKSMEKKNTRDADRFKNPS